MNLDPKKGNSMEKVYVFQKMMLEQLDLNMQKSKPMLKQVWLGGLSTGWRTKRFLVRFPVRTHAWVAGQIPGWRYVRGNLFINVFLLLFLLPFSSL